MVAYDEMFGPDGGERGLVEGQDPRTVYAELQRWMGEATPEFFDARRRQAELFFRRIGITFAVYGEADASERLIPFDIVPRIISGQEWKKLEAGLIQRAKALNAYLGDIYGAGECVKAGIIPADLVYPQRSVPGGDDPHPAAARRLRAHQRHRPRAHGRGRVLRSGRQRPHPLRRLLHAGEPGGDDAPFP